MKMVFSDSTTWMVRFPRFGMVCEDYTDEKVAMEVSALNLIRKTTTIPVPIVRAWGPAVSNSLGLGPFIIMDFINGVSLSSLLQDPNAERPSRVMRDDISDSDIEVIYRHLLSLQTESQSAIPPRPLTFKAQTILQDGGVDTFGDRAKGFATTTDFYDAQNKYVAFKVLESLIPEFINAKYDRCKFKLICDDLGLANLIVRGTEDLTIVGLVDLEWSYIGPAQLFGSAPWWLLQDRPVNSTWDCEGEELPKIGSRYLRYLEIYIYILEEEESKIQGYEERELSSLVKWSQNSGAMWLHMLLLSGFNDEHSFPFTQLRAHLGATEWIRRGMEFDSPNELEEFAARKVREMDMYEGALEEVEKSKALVDSGDMTKEKFIANHEQCYL
ncbi:hypothetical protein N7527_004670 [Penicillium freii]|nr:hypothetical protein N7527_004670 [Penicillium freii]